MNIIRRGLSFWSVAAPFPSRMRHKMEKKSITQECHKRPSPTPFKFSVLAATCWKKGIDGKVLYKID